MKKKNHIYYHYISNFFNKNQLVKEQKKKKKNRYADKKKSTQKSIKTRNMTLLKTQSLKFLILDSKHQIKTVYLLDYLDQFQFGRFNFSFGKE